MTVYVDSTSGVTEYAKNTAYVLGDRVVPAKADTGTNHGVAKKYVWECTTAGTTDATNYPSWDASYTPDSSTETSGTATFTCRNPGYSSGSTVDWTFATIYYEYAVNYAAASAGDLIYVSHDHSESLTANTTYTFLANVRTLCVDTGTGALAETAVIGAQATSYGITMAGAFTVYFRGVTFRIPGSGALGFAAGSTDGQHAEYENCKIELTSSGSCILYLPSGNSSRNGAVILKGCTLKFGSTNQRIGLAGHVRFINCTIDSGGARPATLLGLSLYSNDVHCMFEACNLSHITGTLVENLTALSTGEVVFVNSTLGAGVTIKAAAATVLNKGNVHVWAYNCDSGDNHYAMYHGDAFGETIVSNAVYVTAGGAAYDGTSPCSWKIVTTANCSYYTPYLSPWIDAYFAPAGTPVAKTLYLEALRTSSSDSGADTVYYDDEVWSEWSYQGTSGSTKATIEGGDRMTPLGSRAAQTSSSLGESDWTGELTYDSYFKLECGVGASPTITPQEIGHVRARICAGLANSTIYVDPYIRGLT